MLIKQCLTYSSQMLLLSALLASSAVASTPPFNVVTMPDSSPTHPSGYKAYPGAPLSEQYPSQSADPTAPFQGISSNFRGYQDGGSQVQNAGGAYLAEDYEVEFLQPVRLNSVSVTGFGDFSTGGTAAELLVLGANDQTVLASYSTTNLSFNTPSTYTATVSPGDAQAVSDTIFIKSFDYSTTSRYISNISIDATAIPEPGSVLLAGIGFALLGVFKQAARSARCRH